ncbi:MAG TPA: FdhF/YdeP family oxidoreductase [Kofleriaceae bacterium]|nr:FdhF/YdeP family oxidoreductase [Kofleriaceae bacterium]
MGKPKSSAGGVPAVWQSLVHLRRETGAVRGARALLHMNQVDGFDCPGCAWPDPAERGRFEFCENGAKAFAEEATKKRAGAAMFAERSIADLRALSDFELGKLGRLTEPLIRRPGEDHYVPIAWDEAFAVIADHLGQLSSPDEAVFYTSGRTSNEAAFLLQLFARQLGTNNLPDCSNMCHESSGVGLGEVIGVGKGTVSLDDFEHADAIFIIGQNPGTNHPRMLTALREAARRGARIVTINPLREPGLVKFSHPQKLRDLALGGTPISSLYLQVKIGGDLALIKGIAKEVLAAGRLDEDFIAAHTTGFDDFAAAIEKVEWADLERDSGICREDMRRAAEIYTGAERVIACWAMGITQHRHAVATIQEIVNLLLLGGNLGKPGAGACPVRGHSNVQGDRTMGITHRPSPAFSARLRERTGIATPEGEGLDVVEAISAMAAGRIRVFFSMGGNLLSAGPDTEVTARAMASVALSVFVSTKPNRAHLHAGTTSLILPCLGRTESDVQKSGPQFVTVENSMSVVHTSRGHLDPAGEQLLSEPAIVARMARASFPASDLWQGLEDDYDRIRDLIAAVVPGCDGYTERVREPGGFRLRNAARERDFSTVGGRAKFSVCALPDLSLLPGRLRLMTMRSHDQYNTTIYGLEDRYRGISGERRVIFVNPEDLTARNLAPHQRVDIIGEHEGKERIARNFIAVPFDIPAGCAASYFPEANVLVPLSDTAEKSNTPASKSIIIRLEAAASD